MRALAAHLLLCLSLNAAAGVTVTFPKADRPYDAGEGWADAGRAAAEIVRHLQALGERYLRADEELRIEILEVRLGGRVSPRPEGTRVMTAGDWPRMRMRYELESAGKIELRDEELVSDQNYLRGPLNDWSALGREKRMLDEWFRMRFSPAARTR